MAFVTFSPGAAFVPGASGNDYIQWEDRTGPVGLVDASVLSGDTSSKYVQRIRFWRANRVDKIYLNVESSTPDGTNAFDAGDELNEQWESYSAALVISAGGTTWTFAGPANTQNSDRDSGEPYGWVTSNAVVDAFITAYEAKTDAEKAATTITLNDGNAIGTLNGGLAGSLSGVASLASLDPHNAAGTLAGGLSGSLSGAASIQITPPLNAAGTLNGGLAGSVSGAASLSPVPLSAAGTLDGGLVGSLETDAELYTAPPPPNPMRLWLERLRLPWENLPERWKLTTFQTDLAQRLVDESSLALREWSPLTCRPQTLHTWGETLRRPQRDGETVDAYRVRLLTYRNEPVGQSGWVRDEVERVTGEDPPRVIEFPRDGFAFGFDSFPGRFGTGPSLTVGVEPAGRPDVEAVLTPGVPPKVEITYLEPATFDEINADLPEDPNG